MSVFSGKKSVLRLDEKAKNFAHHFARYRPEATSEFVKLKARPVAEYFAPLWDTDDKTTKTPWLSQNHHISDHEHAKQYAIQLEKFDSDFYDLLQYKKGFQGFNRAKAFEQWWEKNKSTYLSRPVLDEYHQSNLGEFLDDVQMHYIGIEHKKQSATFFSRVLARIAKNRFILAIGFGLTLIVSKLGYFLASLLVLGPGVQMVNSYTQTVITPLAQTASQKGSKDLGYFVSGIQGWLTNREKISEIEQKLSETTEKLKKTDFKKLTPLQIKARWSEFESAYFKLFLSYNQTLPLHLRDGRGLFKEWMIFTPISLAAQIATFDTQYWTHNREVIRLESKKKLNAEDIRQKKMHQHEMFLATEKIAATLAGWKIYEFMYPEFSKASQNSKARNELLSTYNTFIESLHFDLYLERFALQIETILSSIRLQDDSQHFLRNPASSNPSIRSQ